MSAGPTLYKYLYLASDASQEAIEESYRNAVELWSTRVDGEEHLRDIRRAYNILSAPMTRAKYDDYGLDSMLQHEDQYTEETPPSSAQTTPVAPNSQHIPPVFRQFLPQEFIPQTTKRVQIFETEEQQRERRLRQLHRMSEPKPEPRRHTSSLSKPPSNSKDHKTSGSRDKSSKSSSKSPSKSTSKSDSNPKSKTSHGVKAGGSSSRLKDRTSDKDERKKDDSRNRGSKDRPHQMIKPSFEHPIIFR